MTDRLGGMRVRQIGWNERQMDKYSGMRDHTDRESGMRDSQTERVKGENFR